MSGFFPIIMSVRFIHVAAQNGSSFLHTAESESIVKTYQFLRSTGISSSGLL